MRTYIVMMLACCCALAAGLGVASAAPASPASQLEAEIDRHRRAAQSWQRLMGRPVTRTLPDAPASLAAQVSLWKALSERMARLAARPPHERAWRCIQRYEGPWNDPNAPYYGGLQMDISFQRTYGPELLRRKGTANRWTPLEQMWVAERAHRSGRGFRPWPTSARKCGLL